MSIPRRAARVLTGAHLIQAGVLLVQPQGVLPAITGRQPVPPAWIVRVLGVRTGAQALAEAVSPTRAVLRAGVAVDLLHAGSMLGAARLWPRYRRAALVNAGSAGMSAALGLFLAEAEQ